MKITANRNLRYGEYGIRVRCGETVEIARPRIRLVRILERHAKAGYLTIEAAPEVTPEPETKVEPSKPKKAKKKAATEVIASDVTDVTTEVTTEIVE